MKSLLPLAILIVVLFLFWDTMFVYPLQLLVVFFHEASHALATILTGGRVVEMSIVREQGGHVISQGGNAFLIMSAGYLGSLLIGAGIYILAETRKRHDITMWILAGSVVLITLLFIRPWTSLFGFIFSLVAGIGMAASARYLSKESNGLALKAIGLTSMLYVPLDIYSDTIARSHLTSDAALIANTYGGTTWLWGGLWLVLSLLFIFQAFRITLKHYRAREVATPAEFDPFSGITD